MVSKYGCEMKGVSALYDDRYKKMLLDHADKTKALLKEAASSQEKILNLKQEVNMRIGVSTRLKEKVEKHCTN